MLEVDSASGNIRHLLRRQGHDHDHDVSAGQRLFIQPRGTFRYPARTWLDLHLERTVRLGRAELSLAMDAFNALGVSTISEVQPSVNGTLDPRTSRPSDRR